MSICLNFGIISKVSIGSVTGSFTEGNIITIKKVTVPLPKRYSLPYISGECIRYALRQKLKEKGELISPITTQVEPTGRTTGVTKMDIEKYIDDDLFGFMDAKGFKRRTSPIKVSAWIGLFPYVGDRDLGVRRLPPKKTGELQASMFETEIYYNYFAGNIMIDVDRIGILEDEETGKVVKDLGKKERARRISVFISCLPELWGGGRQARFLTDLSPKFLIYTRQTSKVPIFLEALRMGKEEDILLDPLFEVLDDHKNIIENTIVGLRKGIFNNEDEIVKKFKEKGIEVTTIQKAIEKILKDKIIE